MLVGVGTFALFAASTNPGPERSVDNWATLAGAWSLASDGDLTLPQAWTSNPWVQPGLAGPASNRPIGTILWNVPGQWLARAQEGPSALGASAVAALTAALCAVLLLALSARFLGRRESLAAVVVVVLGTSVWTVPADDAWPHGPTIALIWVGLLAAATQRWWAHGAATALATLVRPHTVVIGLVTAAETSRRARDPRPIVWAALGASFGIAVTVIVNARLWGQWTVVAPGYDVRVGGVATGVDVLDPILGLAGTLFSLERGILVLSPFLVALVPGIPAGWRAAPDWVRAAAIGGVAYLVVQLTINPFTGGSAYYGYRLPLEALAAAAPLLMLAWREWTSTTQRRRTVWLALVTWSAFVHGVGAFGVSTLEPAGSAWTTPAFALIASVEPWRFGPALLAALIAGAVVSGRLPGVAADGRRGPATTTPLAPSDAPAPPSPAQQPDR
jgi:alpha-1,2-mannosyltransferase